MQKKFFRVKKTSLVLATSIVIGFLVALFLLVFIRGLEIDIFNSSQPQSDGESQEQFSSESDDLPAVSPLTEESSTQNLLPSVLPTAAADKQKELPTDTEEASGTDSPTQDEAQTNPELNLPLSLKYNVPFTAQAPFGDWDDPLQQDGCEEASALMAVYWAKGEMLPNPETARDIIVAAGEWQLENYPAAHDTSAQDTTDRIIKEYFDWPYAEVRNLTNLKQILEALQTGNLVITPMDGQKLGNPYYTGDGPERHMLVIIGYETETQEFITNDPGTRQGRGFRYDQDVVWNAIRDYPTGNHVPIEEMNKTMIVVSKEEL